MSKCDGDLMPWGSDGQEWPQEAKTDAQITVELIRDKDRSIEHWKSLFFAKEKVLNEIIKEYGAKPILTVPMEHAMPSRLPGWGSE